MSPRLFKKLCKRAAALVIRIDPSMASSTYKSEHNDPPDWNHDHPHREHSILGGTLGFGWVSGYFDPGWEDRSALHYLREIVWWDGAIVPPPGGESWPAWPPGTEPRTWRDYLRHAERMAAAAEAKRSQP